MIQERILKLTFYKNSLGEQVELKILNLKSLTLRSNKLPKFFYIHHFRILIEHR